MANIRDLTRDCNPYYEPGGFPTCRATTAILGKRLVAVSGNRTGGPGLSTDAENVYRVKQIDAKGAVAVGVAKRSADSGKLVPVIASPGIILPVEAGAAIAANAFVIADAQGRVITDDGTDGAFIVGLCMTAASGAGVDAEIKLFHN